MAKGNITIPREFLHEGIWKNGVKFSKVDAFVYLAMRKDCPTPSSYRELAKIWGWSHMSVERFIKECADYAKFLPLDSFAKKNKNVTANVTPDVTANVTHKLNADAGLSVSDVTPSVTPNVTVEDDKKDLFERCWIEYRRKGSKKKAKEYWDKLGDEDRRAVLPHIRAYVSTRELKYQKDFERYLRDKIFYSVVFNNNTVSYDPSKYENKEEYRPSGFGIWRDDETGEYHCWANFDGSLFDGYADEERPDGAKIVLNNARGTIVWNCLTKKWEKK